MNLLRKSFLTIAALAGSAFMFFGCASTSGLTDTLSSLSSAAADSGMGTAASILNASASISKAAEDITPEQSYYIGRAVTATILTNYKPYENPAIEAYLNKICTIITVNSENPDMYRGYHVKMLDTAEVNAFSTSAGHILVTKGLLSCAKSEDALAAVIAHEIAHIQLQHSLKSIKTSRFTAAAAATANAALTVVSNDTELANTLNDMVDDVITDLVNNGYSQGQEFDADELAPTLMADAGYNPKAMDDMLYMMKELQKGKAGGVYKTHPSPEKRIAKVDKALTKIPMPLDTSSSRVSRFNSIMK